MRHRDITMVAAAAAVTAIMVGAAGAAAAGPDRAASSAAATCYDITCRGKDPVAQGCTADAYQVAGFPVTGSTVPADGPRPDVTLWYSPICKAAWGNYHSDLDDETRTVSVYWLPQYGALPGPNDAYTRTTNGQTDYNLPMVPWNNSISVCAQPSGETGSVCSGWR